MTEDRKEKSKISANVPHVKNENNSRPNPNASSSSAISNEANNIKKLQVEKSPLSVGKIREDAPGKNGRNGSQGVSSTQRGKEISETTSSNKTLDLGDNKMENKISNKLNESSSGERDSKGSNRQNQKTKMASPSTSSPSRNSPSRQSNTSMFQNGIYSESLDIPYDLLDFASSPGGADFFEQTRVKSFVDSIKFERIRAGFKDRR